MKAPDRIYLGIEDLGSGYTYALSFEDNGHPSYIRKGALLEWLEEELRNAGPTTLVQHIINKLNSL